MCVSFRFVLFCVFVLHVKTPHKTPTLNKYSFLYRCKMAVVVKATLR